MLVNGKEVTFTDVAPYIEEGRTLVPMRTIFETLGAVVEWDGETKTIISYDPVSDVSITMQADSKTMFINEEPVELDVPATIVGDRTVVPLRAIAEGMNSKVGWDQDTKTVTIEKNINN
ncbi:MAG: copper amine oxidase N-terminal domain-containing protein [Oscillospiraceae bacterium]|nr:copper amine oxidase N-terminal domain-containing protein [Oscillospiraceae bacterium]